MSVSAFIVALKDFVSQNDSVAASARKLRVSPQYLHDTLEGRRQPGNKILKAMKWEKIVTYQPRQ